jgi:hypothetical protein
MVTDVEELTPTVVNVRYPLVAPAAIVITPEPTDRTLEPDVTVTVRPPAGAGELSAARIVPD